MRSPASGDSPFRHPPRVERARLPAPLAPAVEAILSLAPGGQAELVVMALIAGADMGFVVSHHLLRIFIVILGAPILARIMRAKPPR